MRALLVLLSLVVLAAPARADTLDRSTRGQDVTVDVNSPFSELPPGRMAPFRVTIRNDRASAGTWRLFFTGSANISSSGATLCEQDLKVAASSSGVFDILVPLPTSSLERYGGLSLSIGVSGPGFSGSGGSDSPFARLYSSNPAYTGSGSATRTPYTVLGNELLGTIGIGPLASLYKGRSEEFYGSTSDVALLPSDWRGYSGVASLLLKSSEWLSLDPAQRQAVVDYVAMGGRLTLFAADTSDPTVAGLQLPTPDAKAGPYGFGSISLLASATFPPEASALDTALKDHPATVAHDVDQAFSTWGLRHAIGILTVSSAFILLFVVVFGSLIGPVNLFVFAKGSHRLRLFWTTPVISIAASVALVLGILFTDGIGGAGHEMIAIFSLPGQNREAVIQEQVARTAVLFSRGWHNEQNYLITPISSRSLDNAMGLAGARNDDYQRDLADAANVYRLAGNDYSGDWFRSRSVTGQYLQAMRPSRSTLTVMNPDALKAGEPPKVLSSYPQELDRVYLIDSDARYWTCQHLAPGRTVTCSRASSLQYIDFWNDSFVNAGGKLNPLLAIARSRPGYFYATGAIPPGGGLTTLDEIKWHVDQGFFLGPWVASPIPEATP